MKKPGAVQGPLPGKLPSHDWAKHSPDRHGDDAADSQEVLTTEPRFSNPETATSDLVNGPNFSR